MRRFATLLAAFVCCFAVSALMAPSGDSWQFMIGLSIVFGTAVGATLLVGLGSSLRQRSFVLPLTCALGLMAYPGHYLARWFASIACSVLPGTIAQDSTLYAAMVIDALVIGGYWLAVPYALGRALRSRATTAA